MEKKWQSCIKLAKHTTKYSTKVLVIYSWLQLDKLGAILAAVL